MYDIPLRHRITMFNEAISSILKLLKLRQDSRKSALEIERLERQKKEDEALIEIASKDDILRYDARQRELHDKLGAPASAGPPLAARRNFVAGTLLVLSLGVVILVSLLWLFG